MNSNMNNKSIFINNNQNHWQIKCSKIKRNINNLKKGMKNKYNNIDNK